MRNEIISAPISMSSREIAELTGKEHKHVRRDINKMLEALEISRSKFGPREFTDSRGKVQEEYLLDKELTTTLISGYSIKLRHRIVTRWMELEEKQAEALRWSDKRESLKITWWQTQDAIKDYYGEPESYHYANEQNLVYRSLFGMHAVQLKKDRGGDPDRPAKDVMTETELESVAALEAANRLFLLSEMPYDERQQRLRLLATKRRQRLDPPK